jgi:hypothetical protein
MNENLSLSDNCAVILLTILSLFVSYSRCKTSQPVFQAIERKLSKSISVSECNSDE